MLFATVLIAHTALLGGGAPETKLAPPPLVAFSTRSLPALPAVTPLETPEKSKLIANNYDYSGAKIDKHAVSKVKLPVQANNKPAAFEVAAANPETHAVSAAASHAAQLPALQPPPSHRLLYEVTGEIKHIPYSANAELLWQNLGTRYQARLEIAALFIGSRVQTSTGQITDQGLTPERFGDKVRSEVAAHFERDKGKVSFSANTPDVALEAGAQDRLSVLMQLGSLLAGAPKHDPAGSSIAMQTIGPRDADEWRFAVGKIEELNLPAGPHPGRKLSREPQREHDLRVDVWLAPDLDYLPVQLRLTQPGGDFVQLQLKSAEKP